MPKPQHYARFDALDLAPVIACEHTPTGWRGLTADGEILNVYAHVNGSPVLIPDNLAVTRGDEIIGYRAVQHDQGDDGVIADYVRHLDASTALVRNNDATQALAEIDVALTCARTVLARYNRAMILLQLGRWQEGFDEFAYCEQNSPLFMRPQYVNAIELGHTPWRGEDIRGKKLLLIHDHGFGDTIMMLRYVPLLRAMGAEVLLYVPRELERLAAQVAPVKRDLVVDANYVCSILLLMGRLGDHCSRFIGLVRHDGTPENRAPDAPYLQVDAGLRDKWRKRLGDGKHIGVAWSVGVPHDDDYPRSCPQELFDQHLGDEAVLFPVQQGRLEIFEDFADCAALMSLMDEIVTVDTAAVHLAGAIGHPNISLLLSYWASWRWQLPLYQNLRICQQDAPGDWDSAFAKRG